MLGLHGSISRVHNINNKCRLLRDISVLLKLFSMTSHIYEQNLELDFVNDLAHLGLPFGGKKATLTIFKCCTDVMDCLPGWWFDPWELVTKCSILPVETFCFSCTRFAVETPLL